jgi:hypothetical protein
MAQPITPTPKLSVKESEAFLRRLDKDSKKPLTFIQTPKLEQALELLSRDANLNRR